MLAAIESPHTDILGHCTGRLITGKGRPPSAFDAEVVFSASRAHRDGGRDQLAPRTPGPAQDLLRQAAELGCSFSIDTDAHVPGQLEWLPRGCQKAVDADLDPERIVNRGSADSLLAWTASHDG